MTPVFVLGTGRCGTMYLHRVCKQAQLDFPHESAGRHGGVGWGLVVAAAAGQLPEGSLVLHQVREPLSCIASLTTFTDLHWRRLEWMGFDFDDVPLVRAMKYYLAWNRFCEANSSLSYQVRDLKGERVQRIFEEALETELPWSGVPTDTNSRRHGELTDTDMTQADPSLADEIQRYWLELVEKTSARGTG